MICTLTKIINVFTYLCLSCSERGRKISVSNCNISQIKMYFCTDENLRIRSNIRTLEYVMIYEVKCLNHYNDEDNQ